jgi:uncharacterized iron-regulated protein
MDRRNAFVVLFLIIFAGMAFAQEEAEILRLKVGDNILKEKTMTVTAGKIYSADTGEPISFDSMIQEMAGSRIIYVGETHNSLPMHRIQAKIIQKLFEQDRDLSVGLEMYPVTQQDVLKKWSLGILSEEEFIREGQWYVTWNFHFGFYQDIFRVVKKN